MTIFEEMKRRLVKHTELDLFLDALRKHLRWDVGEKRRGEEKGEGEKEREREGRRIVRGSKVCLLARGLEMETLNRRINHLASGEERSMGATR